MSKKDFSRLGTSLLSSVAWLLLSANAFAVADVKLHASTLQPFADTSLALWKEHSFVGNTQYQLTSDNGVSVLKGSAKASASLLYKEFEVSLSATPLLSWHWKIDSVFEGTDERTREGDDFPARVYVVYRHGFLPWQSYAINYVWASNTPKDESWDSPYTTKSKMIAVQSGNTLAGSWQYETRNVADDFAELFDVDIKSLNGVAVMVDADNTGLSAVAHFGAIEFSNGQ